ncbi:MAG: hypothetical protein ACK5HS_05375 [Mycoplasmatales bacterium]
MPLDFSIVKAMKLDGPFAEIEKFLEEDVWDKIKNIAFPALVVEVDKDQTRMARQIKK